jgi:hypothetical protein
MSLNLLLQKADSLRRQLAEDPRVRELEELETAIKVLKRYEVAVPESVPPKAKDKPQPFREGSMGAFIYDFLMAHGPTRKPDIAKALELAGREVNPMSLTSVLSKSPIFESDGAGTWKIAP